MPDSSAYREQIEEIHELNRLFLSYLKRPDTQVERLGLGKDMLAVLRTAPSRRLDAAAEFPRALFRLCLESWTPWKLMDRALPVLEPSRQALQLTLLLSAWNLCRRQAHAARLYFGLSDAEVRWLRATPLGELHRLALGPGLVRCAFTEPAWFWRELLTETRPEYRRELELVALQPNLASGRERPPHSLQSLSR